MHLENSAGTRACSCVLNEVQLLKYGRRRSEVCYHAEIKSTLCRTYFQSIRQDLDLMIVLGPGPGSSVEL